MRIAIADKLERIKRSRLLVRYYRGRYPYESTCRRCGLPWSACGIHDIPIRGTNLGFFCCCEYCWERMGRKEKMAAAAALYDWWMQRGYEPEMTLEEMCDAIAREEDDGTKVDRERV